MTVTPTWLKIADLRPGELIYAVLTNDPRRPTPPGWRELQENRLRHDRVRPHAIESVTYRLSQSHGVDKVVVRGGAFYAGDLSRHEFLVNRPATPATRSWGVSVLTSPNFIGWYPGVPYPPPAQPSRRGVIDLELAQRAADVPWAAPAMTRPWTPADRETWSAALRARVAKSAECERNRVVCQSQWSLDDDD